MSHAMILAPGTGGGQGPTALTRWDRGLEAPRAAAMFVVYAPSFFS